MSIFRGVNFMPDLKGYTGQRPFRFWCQTVLPLVYDDSLSYYELLNKVVFYINNVITDLSATEENVTALATAFENLQKYMNHYFDNLDVQEEIDNKLDKMARDGTLNDIIEPLLEDYENATTERIDAMMRTLTAQVSAFASDIAVLEARMDTFTNLPEGSTTGDAELADARIGVSGETFPNVGDAIRGQIETVSLDVRNLGSAVSTTNIDGEWANYLLNSTTGELQTPSGTDFATTFNKIYIPEGCYLYISSPYAVRIAYYDDNGAFVSCDEQNANYYIRIRSDASARYARVMVWHDISTAIGQVVLSVEPVDGNVIHEKNLDKYVNTFNLGASTWRGGRLPLVLKNTARAPFYGIPSWASGITNVCGKNLLLLCPEKDRLIANGITYDYNHDDGSITITSSGATASGVSANSSFPVEYRTLNGVNYPHNAHFTFPNDTVVSFNSNPSVPITYDYKCQMQISDGNNTVFDSGNGVTILCKANTMYGIRFVVSNGFAGTVTFKPQAEVGDECTAPEVYKGFSGVLGTSTLNSFEFPNKYKIETTWDDGFAYTYTDKVKKLFDITVEGTFDVHAITDTTQGTTINGITWNFLMKFSSATNCIAFIRGIPESKNRIWAHISDGTHNWYDYGDGVAIPLVANTEYGYRLEMKNSGYQRVYIVKPEIFTGNAAFKQFGTVEGTTTIWNESVTTVPAIQYYERTVEEGAEKGAKTYENIVILTGGKIDEPFKHLKTVKMVSFIDDDTSSLSDVRRYHNLFVDHGAVGNYAVMTKHLEDDSTIQAALLDYEKEGFGMLYHCYYQQGDETRYWESGNEMYDETLIRNNFYQGLRYIQSTPFRGWDYWVTPYGVNDSFIQSLAKESDMKCLFTMSGSVYDNSFVGLGGTVSRWNIPRTSISATSNVTRTSEIIEGLARSCGWLTFVTHANKWDDGTTVTTKVGNVIEECKDAGIKIVSVAEAYNTWKCVLEARDMF